MGDSFDGRRPRMPAPAFDEVAAASKSSAVAEKFQAIQYPVIGLLHQN